MNLVPLQPQQERGMTAAAQPWSSSSAQTVDCPPSHEAVQSVNMQFAQHGWASAPSACASAAEDPILDDIANEAACVMSEVCMHFTSHLSAIVMSLLM